MPTRSLTVKIFCVSIPLMEPCNHYKENHPTTALDQQPLEYVFQDFITDTDICAAAASVNCMTLKRLKGGWEVKFRSRSEELLARVCEKITRVLWAQPPGREEISAFRLIYSHPSVTLWSPKTESYLATPIYQPRPRRLPPWPQLSLPPILLLPLWHLRLIHPRRRLERKPTVLIAGLVSDGSTYAWLLGLFPRWIYSRGYGTSTRLIQCRCRTVSELDAQSTPNPKILLSHTHSAG
jgi:hypothetical protein